jgi:hypothetical protein
VFVSIRLFFEKCFSSNLTVSKVQGRYDGGRKCVVGFCGGLEDKLIPVNRTGVGEKLRS